VTAAARINRFLGGNFDEEKMAAAVLNKKLCGSSSVILLRKLTKSKS
jgi:hypothetical protein